MFFVQFDCFGDLRTSFYYLYERQFDDRNSGFTNIYCIINVFLAVLET